MPEANINVAGRQASLLPDLVHTSGIVNELDGYVQSVANPPEAAFDGVADPELPQPRFGIPPRPERERGVPGKHGQSPEARQIADHILGQRRREAGQHLFFGEVAEGQDGHKGFSVRRHIPMAQNPSGIKRHERRARLALDRDVGEVLDLGSRWNLEVTRKAGTELIVPSQCHRTLALRKV
jgi:hypothetical protein